MKKNINGTNFDLDYCKKFSAEKLRMIYNGESKDTLDALIAEIQPEKVEKVEKPKAKK